MNTYMYNTFLRGTLLAVVALSISLGLGATVAQAQEALEVVFNGNASSTAMFGETNFLPGDTAVGTAHVTNHGSEAETVHTDTIFEADPDGLGDHMTLIITDDENPSNTWYDGLFSDFLDGGEVSLGDIDPGETIVYAYTVIFEETTGNDMQEKSLSFDICVGFEDPNGYVCGTQIGGGEDDDDDDNGGGDNGGGGGSGGGGGGGIIESSPLKIMNERVDGITLPQATAIGLPDGTAVIKWETYRNGELEPATSQVIYGLKTHGDGTAASGYPYSINLTQPNFGYPEATAEDTAKVTHHEMTLTGLEVGGIYVYRVVSHASPATVSYQHEFAIPWGVGGDDSYLPEDGGGDGSGNPILADGGTVGGGTYTPPEQEYVLPGDENENEGGELLKNENNGLLPAGLGFLPANLSELGMCAFWFILILVIITIIWRLYRAWREKNGYEVEREEDLRLWIIADILAIIILYFLGIFCPIIPLAILLLILIIWYIKRRLDKNEEGSMSQIQPNIQEE
ncbi:MAG: hypothetical protein H8D63_00650 [Parcubacteria group bacterium]|nr:hypothetical protein [Parcubacteria group bacterium]